MLGSDDIVSRALAEVEHQLGDIISLTKRLRAGSMLLKTRRMLALILYTRFRVLSTHKYVSNKFPILAFN